MRVLVTGSSGFVGRHVLGELASSGHTAVPCDLAAPAGAPPEAFRQVDLQDATGLKKLVAEVQPEACIHLAGIAFVPMGWENPDLVFSTNLVGTLNLLEAFRGAAPQARVLVVTSAEVYGRSPRERAITEDAPLQPDNLYAVSKMAADLSALLFARRYSAPVMTARPQNHIGPGQSSRFVTSAFAEQIVRLPPGSPDASLRVGNLECRRDFTDVRDVARAYRLLIEKGRAGEAYNIASGRSVRIQTVLDELCSLAGIRPKVIVDPALFRPTDSHPAVDAAKIRRDTGWEPRIPLQQTLADILEDMRRRTTAGA